jgi:ABC-type transport system involved in multi-copper enzyme maturation permease subunit
MLWHKAWLESRARFLLSAITIASLSTFVVLYHTDARSIYEGPLSYSSYIWRITYKSYLRELFVLLAVLFGLGGILRERARGTASFTLALPVPRWQLVAVRAVVGILQVASLSFLPALVIPTLSPLVHESYPLSQALQFSLLWSVGGVIFFTVGFLSSVIFAGEFTAPVVSLLALGFYSMFMELPGVERYLPDIHDLMSGAGMPYFQPASSLLIGPLPWRSLAIILVIALGLIGLAGVITQRQDF